ncbi:MAG: ASCH domain-containing protein [Atopobiaceae bacterium]|nr:ASCH domain-containing protein [Atopobiaceae bacterium]
MRAHQRALPDWLSQGFSHTRFPKRFGTAIGEPIPQVGDYSVITDSTGNAVCVIRTTSVHLSPFAQVSADHAYKEAEGDRSLE